MREGRSKEFLDGTRRHGRYRVEIERFLNSRIGQPWSKILSEIGKEFDKRTEAGRQFFRALKWNVETKCWKGAETGTIYTSVGVEVFEFYVHPLSGCLQYKKKPKRVQKVEPVTRIDLGNQQCYEKIKGCWFFCHFKKNDYYLPYYAQANPDASEENKELFTREWTSYDKRQLNSKELKKLGLKNDPQEEP